MEPLKEVHTAAVHLPEEVRTTVLLMTTETEAILLRHEAAIPAEAVIPALHTAVAVAVVPVRPVEAVVAVVEEDNA